MGEKVELKQDKINFISLKGVQTSQDLHTFCNIFEFSSILILEIFHVTNFQLPQKFVANVLPFGENFGQCFKKLYPINAKSAFHAHCVHYS